MKIYYKKVKPVKLMLTPILDVMVTIMIFLLVSFSPEEAKIVRSPEIKVPDATFHISRVPDLQVEVTKDYVKINGKDVPGLIPEKEDGAAWLVLKTQIDELKLKENEPVLLIADKALAFKYVDRTAAHLAAAGHSSILLLTRTRNEEKK
jgi:biopolymer transport protein ExbD